MPDDTDISPPRETVKLRYTVIATDKVTGDRTKRHFDYEEGKFPPVRQRMLAYVGSIARHFDVEVFRDRRDRLDWAESVHKLKVEDAP